MRSDDSLILASGMEKAVLLGDDDAFVIAQGDDNWLIGNAGRNILTGDGGADRLEGRDGDDLLAGGAGNDILVGGRGRDLLTGGRGADTFVFGAGDGRDTLADFNAREGDRIEIDGDLDHTIAGGPGRSTIIALDDGSELVLAGIRPAAMEDSWFV